MPVQYYEVTRNNLSENKEELVIRVYEGTFDWVIGGLDMMLDYGCRMEKERLVTNEDCTLKKISIKKAFSKLKEKNSL